jgi:cytochrome c
MQPVHSAQPGFNFTPFSMKKTIGFLLSAALLSLVSINAQAQEAPEEMKALMNKYTCSACHKVNGRQVGPGYTDVAKKKYTDAQIVNLIYNPIPSHWPGYPPMAAMKQVPKEDALKLAAWINSLDESPKKSAKGKKTAAKRA